MRENFFCVDLRAESSVITGNSMRHVAERVICVYMEKFGSVRIYYDGGIDSGP